MLSTQYHLTVSKVQGVLREFMGLEFSLGMRLQRARAISQALKAQVRNAAVVHLD